MRGADVARGMRPNTSYPLRTRKPPRAPAFDQFSEEFYDRAGAKSLLTTANWHAEALEQRDLLRGRTWHPSYGVDFQRTQKLFRQANYAADALRRWRPQRDDPHKRTRRRRRPSTTGARAVAFEPSSSKGWAHAATGAESAQEASQRFNLKDVEALAKIDSPPRHCCAAATAAEVPFEELTQPHFVKSSIDTAPKRSSRGRGRRRRVPEGPRHFLGDDEPDFSLVSKEASGPVPGRRQIRPCCAADAAAAVRVGADETARKASRRSGKQKEPKRDHRPTNAGRLARVRQGQCVKPEDGTARRCPVHTAPNFGPTPTARRAPPLARRSLSTTTNYPTTLTKDLRTVFQLGPALKCKSEEERLLVRAYHPGARVVEPRVSQEDARGRVKGNASGLPEWSGGGMMRINNKLAAPAEWNLDVHAAEAGRSFWCACLPAVHRWRRNAHSCPCWASREGLRRYRTFTHVLETSAAMSMRPPGGTCTVPSPRRPSWRARAGGPVPPEDGERPVGRPRRL